MPDPVIAEGGPRRCAGVNADGSECKTPEHLLQVDPDEGGEELWCFAHAPWLEQERALSARKGGLRSAAKARRFRFLAPDRLGALDSPTDAKRWSEVIARAVATGELSSNAGNAALKAVAAWLAAHEVLELTGRLAEVEQFIRDAERERPAPNYPGPYMTRKP